MERVDGYVSKMMEGVEEIPEESDSQSSDPGNQQRSPTNHREAPSIKWRQEPFVTQSLSFLEPSLPASLSDGPNLDQMGSRIAPHIRAYSRQPVPLRL